MLRRPLVAVTRIARTRQLSIAAPEAAKQYRSNAEDRILNHMAKVAASAHRKGELDASLEMYEHLVNARRLRHGDRHPLTVSAVGSQAVVAAESGDLQQAESLAREAAESSVDTLGALHPDSLRWTTSLSAVLLHRGELDEAETAAREAVEGYRSVYGDDHDDLQAAERNLRQVLSARSKQA